MQKFKDLIRDEFSGWKPFDIIWLVTVSVVITVMSILFKYDKANDQFYWVLLDPHRGGDLRHHQRGARRQRQTLQLPLRLHPLLPDDLHHPDFQTLCRLRRNRLQLRHAVCGLFHLVEEHEQGDPRGKENPCQQQNPTHQPCHHRGGHRCRWIHHATVHQ